MPKWPTARLGDLAQWLSGGTPRTSEPAYWGGDIPWISAASLKDFFISSSDRNITVEGAASGTCLVPSGTTIFMVRGMSLMSEFRIGITTREVAFGQDCKALIPKRGVDPFFLTYAIRAQTSKILDLVDAAGHGTGRLQTDRIADLQIPIPQDPNEQRRYVALVKALDDKIAVNDRIARKSFELSEVRYKQLISHATEVRPVGDLLDFRYGKALPEIDRAIGNVPVYGSGGITGLHDQGLVLGPGVIVGRKGTVGAVHWSEEDFFPIDTTFYVTLRRTGIPMEFIFFMLRGLGLHTMNSDSAVPGLNRRNALALPARLPDEDDIRIFHENIRPLFTLREALSAESVTLAELRDTLLPKLMSGAIQVRDAEKVVEEVT